MVGSDVVGGVGVTGERLEEAKQYTFNYGGHFLGGDMAEIPTQCLSILSLLNKKSTPINIYPPTPTNPVCYAKN